MSEAIKKDSKGIEKIKADYLASFPKGASYADKTAWNSKIDGYIASLDAIISSDTTMSALDKKALDRARAVNEAVVADKENCWKLAEDVRRTVLKNTSDVATRKMYNSFVVPWADKYGKYVINFNYISRANLNYQNILNDIKDYQASRATLVSLKF